MAHSGAADDRRCNGSAYGVLCYGIFYGALDMESIDMTQEDIIRMAIKAGAISYSPPPMRVVAGVSFTYAQLQRFADIVAEGAAFAEREACARLAEEWLGPTRDKELYIAAEIRARGYT